MSRRRSPYLILGVPYGASKSDAGKAFARATRRLRRLSNPPYDIEDLNWALHAVEQRAEDPSHSIDDYRMPADASAYEVPAGHGMLAPDVQPYPRMTPSTDATAVERIQVALVLEVAAELAKEYESAPLPTLHQFSEEGS